MTRLFLTTCAALVALTAFTSLAHADGEPIVAIDVVENKKTNDETVLLIADIEKGDTWSTATAERVRADLVNSELFKEVQVFAMPVVGGVKVTIVAKDKHSWIIAPTVYLQPGNQGGGFGFAENNLFGANKKLLLYGQVATSDSLFIAGYLDPAFLGSPFYFRADVFLRRLEVTEYLDADTIIGEPDPARLSTELYLNSGFMLGAVLWKGVSIDARLRGAYVSFSDTRCADNIPVADRPALGCEVAPQDDGFDVSTEVKLTYDKRANWYGITTGNLVGLSYERGLPDLGSDFDYWIGYLRLVHARKFWAEHNLVLRGSATYGSNLPFQQELTSGGTNLRGYRNMQFRGDTRVWGSFEYSVPFFKIGPLAFRGLAFADMAYTTFLSDEAVNSQRHYLRDQTEVDSGQFRLGVGAGFRIYVRSIVMPLLGVDVGYGPQADSNYVYFAVGLTEL